MGYGVKEDDRDYALRFGLYSLTQDAFMIPAQYDSLYELDVEHGYYVAREGDGNIVIDTNGTILLKGFINSEGLGIYKQGNYYWLNTYETKDDELFFYLSIYDQKFNLIKKVNNYNNSNILMEDNGTVIISEEIFYKHFVLQKKYGDELYFYKVRNSDPLFTVIYNQKLMVLDNKLNLIAETSNNRNKLYSVYGDIFIEEERGGVPSGVVYDKNGTKIVDTNGNYYSNIVHMNYWDNPNINDKKYVFYHQENNKLRVFQYDQNIHYEIELGDWKNATVEYVFHDLMIILSKDSVNNQTRIYKGNQLLFTLDGWYYKSYLNQELTDRILLTTYSSEAEGGYHMILDTEGQVLYQTKNVEDIQGLDKEYILVNRGNYTGVIDYKGNFLVKTIRNSMSND